MHTNSSLLALIVSCFYAYVYVNPHSPINELFSFLYFQELVVNSHWARLSPLTMHFYTQLLLLIIAEFSPHHSVSSLAYVREAGIAGPHVKGLPPYELRRRSHGCHDAVPQMRAGDSNPRAKIHAITAAWVKLNCGALLQLALHNNKA